jgi:alpha/beta superfamily hydrolase
VQCKDSALYCEVHIPDVAPAPAVLIGHGLNSQGFHTLKAYGQLARSACRKGFLAVLFDFSGVGKSTGTFDYGIGEQRDILCMLSYVASRPEVLTDRIFVVGHSLGGAVSLYALRDENRVKGLVLWSTPKDHDYNVRKFITRTRGKRGLCSFLVVSRIDKLIDVSRFYRLEVYGIKLRPRDVREKLMSLNECQAISKLQGLPVLVVVGSEDEVVGVDEAREVFNSAHEPKSFLIIAGADHTFRRKEDELVSATIDWIEKLKEKVT